MERFKRIINKLLNPNKFIVVLSIPLSVFLILYVFLFEHEDEPFAYISYIISAYSLTIVSVQFVKTVKLLKKRFTVFAYKNQFINKYMTNFSFRTKVLLYQSFVINLFYAVMNLCIGVYYHSVWFGTLAVYYIFLAVMRFLLLRHINRNTIGQNLLSEFKRYRICGFIFLMMNIALLGVVILVIYQNRSFQYAGMLIYVMAMYAFYTIITAVINVIKFRKYESPVMSASKAINLAAALVSMLSLETAMITQFGTTGDSIFRQVMIASTGGVVCIIVFCMAIFMIIYGSYSIRKLSQKNT